MGETNRIVVRVKGVQRSLKGQEEVLESEAEGQYYYRGGKHYVRYIDEVLDKEAKTSTVLKFSPESLVLLRKGAVELEQRFAVGKETKGEYRTRYGSLDLSVETDRLDINYDPVSGGQIDVSYEMSINGEFNSTNTLHIEIESIAAGVH